MRRNIVLTMALAVAVALGTLAPAMAKGPSAERGNSASAIAEPVELTADDLGASMCDNGEDVRFYTVRHDLANDVGDADDIWWREPPRLGGQNIWAGDGTWNTLYLGVSGPECGDIQHKGKVTVYYEIGDDIYSIEAQFNGQGELLHVNGVKFDG